MTKQGLVLEWRGDDILQADGKERRLLLAGMGRGLGRLPVNGCSVTEALASHVAGASRAFGAFT